MKNILYVLAALVVLPVLTGCATSRVTYHEDGSVTEEKGLFLARNVDYVYFAYDVSPYYGRNYCVRVSIDGSPYWQVPYSRWSAYSFHTYGYGGYGADYFHPGMVRQGGQYVGRTQYFVRHGRLEFNNYSRPDLPRYNAGRRYNDGYVGGRGYRSVASDDRVQSTNSRPRASDVGRVQGTRSSRPSRAAVRTNGSTSRSTAVRSSDSGRSSSRSSSGTRSRSSRSR